MNFQQIFWKVVKCQQLVSHLLKKRGFSSFGNATSNTSEKRTSNITPKSIKITNSKKSHKANMAKLKKEKKLIKIVQFKICQQFVGNSIANFRMKKVKTDIWCYICKSSRSSMKGDLLDRPHPLHVLSILPPLLDIHLLHLHETELISKSHLKLMTKKNKTL